MSDEQVYTEHNSPDRPEGQPDNERANRTPEPAHSNPSGMLGQVRHDRYPTTSFLTATTLIYAIRAGITAAAGTRLAL